MEKNLKIFFLPDKLKKLNNFDDKSYTAKEKQYKADNIDDQIDFNNLL